VERRGGTKENAELQSTVRTQSRAAVSQAQARIREAVSRDRQDKLTALLHHLTVDALRASFFGLKKSAAPGVDEVTWTEYAEDLEVNLSDLHSRVQAGAYRALPSRRTYIPKADGRQRPLGIAALEDKIVQAAMVTILTPIYEAVIASTVRQLGGTLEINRLEPGTEFVIRLPSSIEHKGRG
jgi:RNA-directed DNA polymerase